MFIFRYFAVMPVKDWLKYYEQVEFNNTGLGQGFLGGLGQVITHLKV